MRPDNERATPHVTSRAIKLPRRELARRSPPRTLGSKGIASVTQWSRRRAGVPRGVSQAAGPRRPPANIKFTASQSCGSGREPPVSTQGAQSDRKRPEVSRGARHRPRRDYDTGYMGPQGVAAVRQVRGHILGHICPWPDATRRGQTQKVPVFFSRKMARSNQTQPHAKDW